MSNSNNFEIWDRVFKTDPAYTKGFNRAGGFKGTAVSAMYQVKRATELFGPCGLGWGVEVLEDKVVDGHPLLDDDKKSILGYEKVHYCRIELWYKRPRPDGASIALINPLSLPDEVGRIQQYGQTTMVTRRKDGSFFTDEEAPKKSITDATLKALSMIGFSADIHMGLFDDNKYVNDRKNEVAEEKRAKGKAAAPKAESPAASEAPAAAPLTKDEVEKMLFAAGDMVELQSAGSKAGHLSKDEKAELGKLYSKRVAELKEKK